MVYIYLINAAWWMYPIHYKKNSKCCLMSFHLFNVKIYNFVRKLAFPFPISLFTDVFLVSENQFFLLWLD